jgi:hypothetical protein
LVCCDHWLAAGQFAYDFAGQDWWLNEAAAVTDT